MEIIDDAMKDFAEGVDAAMKVFAEGFDEAKTIEMLRLEISILQKKLRIVEEENDDLRAKLEYFYENALTEDEDDHTSVTVIMPKGTRIHSMTFAEVMED